MCSIPKAPVSTGTVGVGRTLSSFLVIDWLTGKATGTVCACSKANLLYYAIQRKINKLLYIFLSYILTKKSEATHTIIDLPPLLLVHPGKPDRFCTLHVPLLYHLIQKSHNGSHKYCWVIDRTQHIKSVVSSSTMGKQPHCLAFGRHYLSNYVYASMRLMDLRLNLETAPTVPLYIMAVPCLCSSYIDVLIQLFYCMHLESLKK